MYQVIVLPKALKDLSNLDKSIAKRVIDKLKIGDYRALYDIEHSKKIIYIHKIGHRKDIYKY